MSCCCCFFFSSRRRHTRCSRDWSSDVCSSDLGLRLLVASVALHPGGRPEVRHLRQRRVAGEDGGRQRARPQQRSEEHTSELQSRLHLVCRLLLEKKKKSSK